MRDIRIICESPSPGKMHFTTYRQAAWIEREHVFLIGLGADNFPGIAIEDPLLLDHERMPPMITSAQRISKNIEIMNSFLASVEGNLTCSYSSFDTVENRECYPATLFHRLRESVSDDTMTHVGFIMDDSERFIDENDYWLHSGVNHGVISSGEKEEIAEEFPDTAMWQSADQMSDKVLSASSLTTYLNCKHKFFLKNILRLSEIKDHDFDTLGWLSALETGNVYHSIFEKFLIHAKENPDFLSSEELAVKGISIIAEDEIARCEEELPTASNFHTERQKEEVFENVAKFAINEVQMAKERTVAAVEMAFGEGEPLILRLDNDKMIMASGYIDRVDVSSDGSVGITDYKTGRKGVFDNLQDPKEVGITEGNAQLALYYLALKEVAQKSDDPELVKLHDLKNMSYQFVTAKGDYDVVSLNVTDESESCYRTAFSELIIDIEKGQFPPEKGGVRLSDKEKEPNCRYCGYSTVCTYSPDTVGD